MGSGGVGKSAMTVRFINGSYLEWYDPTSKSATKFTCSRADVELRIPVRYPELTGADRGDRKQIMVDRQPSLLEILDTGQLISSLAHKLMISRCGSVPEPERYVCPRIGRFRPRLFVNQLFQFGGQS